ncbi:hypothetical protein ACE38W_03655 [Chitinophaga sp. Hz27]|uniref:hypothetical protein n=1 Tax=Chitinophaga sp. Hz27 TaxID=3347169 RepID=UPI0035DA34E9
MKYIFLLCSFLVLSMLAQAQSKTAIINLLRQKQVTQLMQYCDLPFCLNVGSKDDNRAITDKAVLKKALETLVNRHYFDDFFKKGKSSTNNESVSYLLATYNGKEQTFISTSIVFQFKQLANKKLLLETIRIAG